MIKERLNNKYLRVSTMKPHLCVKNIDKTSSLCFTTVILTLCGDVTVTFVHARNKMGIKLNHETNGIVSEGVMFKCNTRLGFV